MDRFSRDGFAFDVRDEGPPDGDVAVLLHGFPQHAATWDRLAPRLHEAGLRTLAPDQRGYSPGARPRAIRAYRLEELVADVLALVDASGAAKVHLVGHDWGGIVGWAMAARHPERLATFTSLSTPHPQAFARSLLTSTQLLRSTYVAAFQVPGLPEQLLSRPGFVRRQLQATGLPEDLAAGYAEVLEDVDRARAAISWYRALRFASPGRHGGPSRVPTLFAHGSGDAFLTQDAARATERHVDAPYRFLPLEGAGHWLPELEVERLAPAIVDWVAAHPAR